MKYSWANSVFPIAAIFSFRMLGLFMLIPVFTVFAPQLEGATPALIGIALGSYGLSQGILQIPFGILSDHYGRKNIITLGLLLFIAGSLLGAVTHSIYGMIIARTLQGTGAIGSVLIALLADLTTDDERTKSMAIIGVTIGVSFSLAMVISPAITHHFGLSGIFYFTTLLAISGLVLLHWIIPTPPCESFHGDSEAKSSLIKTVIFDKQLQRLNAGIFFQHLILTSTFFAIPLLLQHQLKQGNLTQQWHFYLPMMVIAFLLMIPFLFFAEKKKQMKPIFILAILTTGFTQLLLSLTCNHWWSLCVLMLGYFAAFNILEASLPSLISKAAKPAMKGTAMGVYSSCQFLGIFAGGLIAGILFQHTGIESIFISNTIISLLWIIVALPMKSNLYHTRVDIIYDTENLSKRPSA
jgi:MFS family permease